MPDRDYLLYIGEALRMVNRMRQHRRAADRLRRKSEPRALRSSRFDWRLGTQLSRNPGRIEVSWTLCDAGRRKGLELELIELHRVTLARMPQWQLLVQLRPEEALEKSQERARRWLRRHPQQARLEQERPATPARNSSP